MDAVKAKQAADLEKAANMKVEFKNCSDEVMRPSGNDITNLFFFIFLFVFLRCLSLHIFQRCPIRSR